MSALPHALVFDVSRVSLVQSPGFVPPRLRARYTDETVQRILLLAFDGMLPPLSIAANGDALYRWEWQGREMCARSTELAAIDEIPAGEAMRMLQGFIRLHQMLAADEVPEGARSLLLNLRIPHPETAIHLYRKCQMGGDEERLLVLHGFEGEAWPVLPMEDALAILMHASTLQIEEFAASMQATQPIALPATPARQKLHWKWIASAAAAAAILITATLMRAPTASGQNAQPEAARPPANTASAMPIITDPPRSAQDGTEPIRDPVVDD